MRACQQHSGPILNLIHFGVMINNFKTDLRYLIYLINGWSSRGRHSSNLTSCFIWWQWFAFKASTLWLVAQNKDPAVRIRRVGKNPLHGKKGFLFMFLAAIFYGGIFLCLPCCTLCGSYAAGPFKRPVAPTWTSAASSWKLLQPSIWWQWQYVHNTRTRRLLSM